MDLEDEIKHEPIWSEGTENTSPENFELGSQMVPPKQETKPELTEPGPTQENTFEPSPDIKEEIFIEQRIVEELIPCFKEEKNAENVPRMVSGPLQLDSVCSKAVYRRSHLKSHQVHETTIRNKTSSEKDKYETPSMDGVYHCNECTATFSEKSTSHSLINAL